MQGQVKVTGLILKTEPIGEYDRRIVILTGERGKISAFARGARKQGSRLLAATTPFCFGEFRVYEGRNSYTVGDAAIQNYFEALREDYEKAYYGMYFLEVMDYYTREGSDERQMLNLLYQSLKALCNLKLNLRLIRYIFEIKALALNGEYPGIPEHEKWKESTRYAVDYIAWSEIKSLYSFDVTEEILEEIEVIAGRFRKRFVDRPFKSLDILNTMLS